jgi:isochorismate synthase
VSAVSNVSLHQFFAYCVDRNLPFAFYRLPDTNVVKVIAQHNSVLNKVTFDKSIANAKGFLLAPFQDDEQHYKVLIKPDVFCEEKNLPKLNFAKHKVAFKEKEEKKVKLKETSKTQYQSLVQKIKKEISNKHFEKVIAARVVKKKQPEGFDAVKLFQNLCSKYPQAFVSLVCTSEFGLWIGASPEILLSANKKEFKSYALAGTKANTPKTLKAAWGDKEMQEHKIVSQYITKAFAQITKAKPTVTGPETVVAGNLLHLRTTLQYKAVAGLPWQKVVTALHPTPAVAGLPTQKAIEFIIENEKTSRSFYSGYLGPVNMAAETNLFVNLRCMRVLKNKLAIYVGCGVTVDSVPESEWKESKLKSETLMSAL